MHPKLIHLHDVDQLERLLDGSRLRPVVLFKHSFSCGTSAEALDELIAHLDVEVDDADYALVTVQTHRDVSNAVTTRLGVRHETPQAIVLRGGRVTWTASHFRVKAHAISQALLSACGSPEQPGDAPSGDPGR